MLLPENVLRDAVTPSGELTISFDVNVGTATDFWFSPIFTAYEKEAKTNGTPMLAVQSRKLLQVNCNGWCDFTKEDNEKNENVEDTFWFDDQKWHKVAVTFTKKRAVYYIDGEIVNSWTLSGTEGHTVDGLLSPQGAGLLKYICLGGNQAWDWPNYDPAYYFDNIAIYSKELTADQIKK